jgi:hypothetical protein
MSGCARMTSSAVGRIIERQLNRVGSKHYFVVFQKALKMIGNIFEICRRLLVQEMGTALDTTNRLPKTVKRIALHQAAGKAAVRVPKNCGVDRIGIDFDLLFSHDLVYRGG